MLGTVGDTYPGENGQGSKWKLYANESILAEGAINFSKLYALS